MYNRYIPQNDGTYRRSRINEPSAPPPKQPAPPPESESCGREEPPCRQGQPCAHLRPPRPVPPKPKAPPIGLRAFFSQLIPADFDTEDLIVVLLLLLMAGECREDQNVPLLTLFLYLFL